ncbi:L-methionine/branched-chain amino acid transporter [Amphritea sp. 1_MG-2023]|uniref:L-methionine/branched-chain amino acid transporter n=1 Tax=Amphritea sp. 1_MG-2023 TaxID=3062670 RepID=UPI0026E43D3F|nr:L-methionine/branched-chain amino acid transporter [Amphritea sp. 1_MG-2023]MDO6562096.1 L-methionine/branched-chain amino acid transporter [Amphritea sp. 1_MG-2023]
MPRLNQTITRWQGVGLIATTLLGTGVFILPQLTIAAAGDKAIWAWVILLLGILPLAYIFAELGRRFTHAAGPAYFVERAFGQFSGRLIGLLFLFTVPPGVAAALIMTFKFIQPIITLSDAQTLVAELLVFALLFFINRRGLQLSGRIQMGLTLLILLVVLLMMVMVVIHPPTVDPTTAISADGSSLMPAIGLAIWSFIGIEAITHLAGEFKDVQRDFIPASLLGVSLVGLIFIGCTWLSMLAPEQPLAMVGVFEMLFGSNGRWIIGALGFISGIATINIYFASLSRLAWNYSQEGILPQGLQSLNRHKIPTTALITFMLISAAILLISYLENLDFSLMAHWVNGSFIVIYSASMLAAWKLLPHRHKPAIIIGLCACALFTYCLGAAMLYALIIGLLISLVLLTQQRWQRHYRLQHPIDL